MKNIKLIIGVFLLTVFAATGSVPVAAATNGMQITAINLPPVTENGDTEGGDDAGGEAVLVESQGRYLLMDTGKEEVSDILVASLKAAGVTELDVYISHTHNDHRGGLKAVCDNFKVDTIYLPDMSIGTEYKESGTGTTQTTIYKIMNQIAANEGANVVYLNQNSVFSFGSVNAKVLGPVGNYKMEQFGEVSGNSGSKSGHYLNNYSLTTMLTCGNTKFLTCGDIEKEEEKALVSAYGSGLDADILKLSHHGLPTSNTEDYMRCVTPSFSFGENASYVGTTKTESGNVVKKTYTSQKTAMDYGFCYMVGDEKQNLIINVEGDKVSLYRGNLGNQLTGWTEIEGIAQKSDGSYTDKNSFYIDLATGKPLTGVQKIGGKYYYLGTGGCMEKGYYDNGKYVPYRSYGNKIRHFATDGAMTVGFVTIDGNKFYFDNDGYKVLGDKKWGIYELDGKWYAINENGAVFTNKNKGGWKKYSSTKLRYFNADGSMATGWKKVKGKYYYLDDKSGFRTYGAKKVGNSVYFLHETYGFRIASKMVTDKSKDTYLLNKKGCAYTGLTKYNGKYYFFDKETAIMQKGLVQDGTKLYYFDSKTGIGTTNKKVKIAGKSYKTNAKAMITNVPSFVKKKVSGLKVKSGVQKVNVSFKKISGVGGYEIYISESADNNYRKVKTLSKPSKVNAGVSGLSSGKTYYIKVCAYKKMGKVKIYSKFSSVKKVAVK